MNEFLQGIINVALAITGVAIVAVLVSKQAQTPQVVQSVTQGFAADLAAAVSPITGGGGIGYSGVGNIF